MSKLTLNRCACGGAAHIRTRRVAEDAVETWAECGSCGACTDTIEDAYPDSPTAAWQWNCSSKSVQALTGDPA